MDSHIYNEHGSAGGQPTPSFIPPPLNPYNRLLVEVLMERGEDLEDGEMVDREMEDGGEGSNIYEKRQWQRENQRQKQRQRQRQRQRELKDGD